MSAGWIEAEHSGDVVRLKIWLQPRAAKVALIGIHQDALKVTLTSPPVDNRANDQLIRSFADWLDMSRGDLSIVSGRTGRNKILAVRGLSVEEIKDRLGARFGLDLD